MSRPPLMLLCLVTAGLLASACGPSAPTPTASPTAASRPSSPAKLSIVSPQNNEVLHGTTMHIVLQLTGGQITSQVTKNVTPTLGHIHLYVNGQLTYMNYGTTVDVPVQPGNQYQIYAEFVAADHYPFNPRVLTPTIYVTVEP